MSSRKQNGSRFLFSPEHKDFVTHVTLVQRNAYGERDWRDLTRNTRERHVVCKPFILPTEQILGIRRGRYRHGGRRVAWYIWSEPCVLLIYCCSVRCTFARSFNEHSNSQSLCTLICNTFDRRSSKFPAQHLSLLLEWFSPFLSPLFLLLSILVSSFYLSVNIVVLYQFTVTCIEVSRSGKEFKVAIIFRRRSREDSLFQALHYL